MRKSYTGRTKSLPKLTRPPAPGARLRIRGEEWILRHADRTFDGHYILTCTGITPTVRDHNWQFLTEYATFEEVDPKRTQLIHDSSRGYEAAKLHLESHLRITPPTDQDLYIGNRGAMDDVNYQRVPVLQALDQLRPRILIADGTGLGKTLEAGMLMVELIRRGRGKRILVVTLKSMLTQFQKEMWTRFTIPLIRLDSAGISRVQAQIPLGHNPFNHFDKTIISIDTLKINSQYQTHIENSNWDIIVIDEAQNVAKRGSKSLRHRLALLLANRSDALIMLSATPHDGRARSFASLINMLDPTVLTNPDTYTKKDFEGRNLLVRRFKKDIKHDVVQVLKDRETRLYHVRATESEEAAYTALTGTANDELFNRRKSGMLLRTVLEKAVLSSPVACLETVNRRIAKMKKTGEISTAPLERIAVKLESIDEGKFSKYSLLLALLDKWRWNGKDSHDRIVIFSERVATVKFLKKHLQNDLTLRGNAIRVLMGEQKDTEQQEVVDDFGSASSPVRILLSTDVGSEGINLHYHCHRLIHFDIPWSIMVLQQRNGRIDRYGQKHVPKINYLLNESAQDDFKADQRILELLIDKEKQAHENIGDPASIMGVYDKDEEEEIIVKIMEGRMTTARAETILSSQKQDTPDGSIDPLAHLLTSNNDQPNTDGRIQELPTVYDSDYAYLKSAMRFLGKQKNAWQCEVIPMEKEQRLRITVPESMKHLLLSLPVEARPKDKIFDLTADPKRMMEAIKSSISEDGSWPALQFLWPLHPIMDWVTDKVHTTFKRLEAPAIMTDDLEPGEQSYILSISFPNRRGVTIYQRWLAIRMRDGEHVASWTFNKSDEFQSLRNDYLVNSGPNESALQKAQDMLPKAVKWANNYVRPHRDDFEAELKVKRQEHLDDLKNLYQRRKIFLDEYFGSEADIVQRKKQREVEAAEQLFDDFTKWIKSAMTMGDDPYVEVIAVFIGH